MTWCAILTPTAMPPKGRGPIASPNGTATPGGDGWYKFTETCTRDLTHPEAQPLHTSKWPHRPRVWQPVA